MILPNAYLIKILKETVKEYRMLFNFSKSDLEFNSEYGFTKGDCISTVRQLERQIMGCEKDINTNTYAKMAATQKITEQEIIKNSYEVFNREQMIEWGKHCQNIPGRNPTHADLNKWKKE